MRRGIPLLALLLALIAAWFLPVAMPSGYFLSLLTRLLILTILAGSLNLLMGYVGLTSFGHAAFFGAGGYVAAVLFGRVEGVDLSLALLGAAVGALVVALAVGPLVLRSRGVYFTLVTLAVGQVLWGIADAWKSVTGGSDGLLISAGPAVFGWSVANPAAFFRLTLVVWLSAMGFLRIVMFSPFGKALKGVREAESRMEAFGYNVFALQYLAFVLSAALAGLAGGLLASFNRFISPEAMGIRMSAELVLTVILGGPGSFWGPLIAAALVFAAAEVSSLFTASWPIVLGLLFVGTAYVDLGLLRRIGRAAAGGRVWRWRRAMHWK